MLTDKEMLEVAEKYLKKIGEPNNLDLILLENIKKPYGIIYHFNSKQCVITGDFRYSVVGNAPFLVEKEKNRVVQFGTAGSLEDQLEDFENGTFVGALDTYWYPDEDRFSHK